MKLSQALSQESTVFLLKKLWRFSQGMHQLVVLYVAMFVLANVVQLTAPLMFGAIIADIQARGVSTANLPYLSFLLSLLFAQTFLFWLLHGPARVIERSVAFRVDINYRRHLLGGVLGLGLNWHGEHDSGNTIDKVNKAGEGMFNFGENIYQIVQIVVKILGTTAVLLWFSPWVGLFVFAFIIFAFAVIFQFDKRLLPQYRGLNEFSNKAQASVFDALSNVTTVKILHIEKPVLEGVISRFQDPSKLYRAHTELNEWKWFTGNMFFQGIVVVPLALYLYYAIKSGETIDAGVFSTLYLYLAELVLVWFAFGSFYEQIFLYKNRVLNAEPIEEAFSPRGKITRTPVGTWSRFILDELSFGYANDPDSLQLDQLAMEIKHGERIAVIGESGSGKSTFLKVLHGMYPNARAVVRVDKSDPFVTNFVDIDLGTMLVPQEPEIFSSTIRENITLGIAYAEESVLQAAHIAAFDKVIDILPNGLESVINEKGVNLSGGQKQRLALTRAILFFADKEIILLDESTSSVDSENETEIYERIFSTFSEKTVIASIHKMNLLRLFDRILMFENGAIIDEGTFEELLERNSSFREAWDQFIATS